MVQRKRLKARVQTTIQAQLCLHPATTVTPNHFTGSGDSREPATVDLGIWEGDGWVWGDSRFCAVRSGSRQRLALQLKRLPTATPEVTQDRCSLIWREPLPCRLPMESGARCSPWETCGESRYPPPPSPQAQWRRNRAPCAAHPGVPIPEGSDLASVRSQTPTSPLAMSGCLASPSGRPGLCPHFNQFGKCIEQLLYTRCISFLLPLYQITTTS